MTFQILESASREEWLEQRKNYLTATDISTLYTSGPSGWEAVAESKSQAPEEFSTKATAWGVEREPIIADYVTTFVDSSLRLNDNLVVSTEDPRFAATPDMISSDAVGDVLIGEIKTANRPLNDIPLDYMVQMQWQMMVCGAQACVFAWEQHEDYVPVAAPQHVIVHPDREMQAELVSMANRFYGTTPDSDIETLRFNRILEQWSDLDRQKRELERKEALLKEQIRELSGGRDFRFKSSAGSVTYTLPKARESFDAKAFAEAHPDLHKQFVKHSAPKSRTLRITLPKEES